MNRAWGSPSIERHAVQACLGRARGDVEYVFAFAGIVWRRGIGALAPAVGGAAFFPGLERVARQAAQKIDVLLRGTALVGHALDQFLEFFRIAGGAQRQLDAAIVRGALVGIDGFPDLDQGAAQLLLLRPLQGHLRHRHGHRCQRRHDGQRDHQLDEGKTLLFHWPPHWPPLPALSPAAGTSSSPVMGEPVRGAACSGAVMASGVPPTLARPPTAASVPELNSAVSRSGRRMLRSRRGVIDSTISLRMASSFWLPNNRFSTGSSPTPGTLLAVPRSSSLIRPASTCVSPSFRRSTVEALRVPIW